MKIAVCVKEVPDATAHKRIDPGTKRLDRSGEGALNAFDANAVEEALRLKAATGEGEVVVVSMGPERALNSLRKALAMGADRALLDLRPRRRRLRPRRDERAPREGARARAARPRPLRPAVVRLGRRRALGRGRRAAEPPRDLPGRRADARRRLADRQAADRVRLRRDPRAAAGRRRGRRLDQRAALPVAEGDHGREVEAAGDALARRPRRRRRSVPARGLANRSAGALRSAAARRHAQDRGRR